MTPKRQPSLEHIRHQVKQEPAKQKNKHNEREPHEDEGSLVVTGFGCGDPDHAVKHPKNTREEVDHWRMQRWGMNHPRVHSNLGRCIC